MPTINKILKVVNDDTDLPTFKHTTFYLILKKDKFTSKFTLLNFSLITKGIICDKILKSVLIIQ